MPAKQRMRVANEKHSQNVLTRGNVPKSLVRPVWNCLEDSCTPFRKRRKTTSYWSMRRFNSFWLFLTTSLYFFRNHKRKSIQLDLFFLDYLFSSCVDQVSNWKVKYSVANFALVVGFWQAFMNFTTSGNRLTAQKFLAQVNCCFLLFHSDISDHSEHKDGIVWIMMCSKIKNIYFDWRERGLDTTALLLTCKNFTQIFQKNNRVVDGKLATYRSNILLLTKLFVGRVCWPVCFNIFFHLGFPSCRHGSCHQIFLRSLYWNRTKYDC